MKTIMKAFFGLVALAVVGIVVLLKYGSSSGEAKVREFFTMAKTAPAAQLDAQIHAALKKQVDPQIFAAFVKEIATRFGDFKSIHMNGFEFSDKLENGHREREYKGTFVFEKKEVPLEISFIDEQLGGLIVKDAALGNEIAEAVNTIPSDTTSYQKRGEEFLRAMLSGKPDAAFNMMHEALQKQLGRQTFDAQLASFAKLNGVKKIDVVKARPRPNKKDMLDVIYSVQGGSGDTLRAHVSFQFAQLRGHLVGFQVPSKMQE